MRKPLSDKTKTTLIFTGVALLLAGCVTLGFVLITKVFYPVELLEEIVEEENSENTEENSEENSKNDGKESSAGAIEIVETFVPGKTTATGAAGAFAGQNCTLAQGILMLINPVFRVGTDFIAARRAELINIQDTYGIREGLAGNGAPLMDAEAAAHLNSLVRDYQAAYPGHTLETRSCFRSVGTNCGRLCYATGTSDHHTGYTCDLLDPAYGTSLDTDTYAQHLEWQWLRANSYKYGFIDRFPVAWAGGSMAEPVNITEAGSTGLFETWHYRYVGVTAATEIATGKYNGGQYDSLEHYLKATGVVNSLTAGTCNR